MRTTILTILLLFISQDILALKTINKISKSDFNGAYSSVMLNGKLFYLDSQGYMWTSEGTSSSTHQLSNGNQAVKSYQNSLIKFNERIVFINLSDELKLWATDGTSFELLDDTSLNYFSGLRINNNTIMAQTVDENFIFYDGTTVSHHDASALTSPLINSLCRLNETQFTVIARSENSNAYNLYYFNAENFTLIADDIITDDHSFSTDKQVLNFENNCYYQYTSMENIYSPMYLQVTNNGNTAQVISSDGTDSWKQLFVFNDKLYFIRNSPLLLEGSVGFDTRQMYQLEANSNTPFISNAIDFSGPIRSVNTSDNNLYVLTDIYLPGGIIPSPMPPPLFSVYDSSFQEVNIEGSFFAQPKVVSVGNNDTLLFNGQFDELYFTGNNGTLKMNNASLQTIVGDETALYAIGSQGLYKISNQAIISEQTAGLWISPEWQSQGITLHTGERPDESNYLFLSLFIYKDGLPFWVAGSTDYDLGNTEISLELLEFTGSSFLDDNANTAIESSSFGTITLSPSGCDEMEAFIEITGSDALTLNLGRIIDTKNRNVCIP